VGDVPGEACSRHNGVTAEHLRWMNTPASQCYGDLIGGEAAILRQQGIGTASELADHQRVSAWWRMATSKPVLT